MNWLRLKEAAPGPGGHWLRHRFWLKLVALGLAIGTWVAVRQTLHL